MHTLIPDQDFGMAQLGAHASNQSQIIENYEELTDKLNSFDEKYKDTDIPRPDHWEVLLLFQVQ